MDQPTANWNRFFLLFVILSGLAIARLLLKALASPWTWNENQIYATALVLVYGAAATRWFLIWWRSPEEARARWDKFTTDVFAQFSNPRIRLTTSNVVVWVVVAVALIALFNLQRH